jgi:hypothetical protein
MHDERPAMRLATMRYTKIDGTSVAVSVTSSAEAKTALKELRHKKRELKFIRSALLRRQKAARARQPAKSRRRVSFFGRLWSGFKRLVMALVELVTVPRTERRSRSLPEIERELKRTDQLLHNVEGCILQLEGKLLARGA